MSRQIGVSPAIPASHHFHAYALWKRGDRFYGRLTVEDERTGLRGVKRVLLADQDGGVLVGKVYGHLADEHRKAMAGRLRLTPTVITSEAVNE